MRVIKAWTSAEKARLVDHWYDSPRETILKAFPGRTWPAIEQYARKIGLRRPWKWTGKRKDPKDNLMRQLRAAREERNLTAKALAEKINLCDRFIAQCERGTAQPSYHMLTRWCAALGVRLSVERRIGV